MYWKELKRLIACAAALASFPLLNSHQAIARAIPPFDQLCQYFSKGELKSQHRCVIADMTGKIGNQNFRAEWQWENGNKVIISARSGRYAFNGQRATRRTDRRFGDCFSTKQRQTFCTLNFPSLEALKAARRANEPKGVRGPFNGFSWGACHVVDNGKTRFKSWCIAYSYGQARSRVHFSTLSGRTKVVAEYGGTGTGPIHTTLIFGKYAKLVDSDHTGRCFITLEGRTEFCFKQLRLDSDWWQAEQLAAEENDLDESAEFNASPQKEVAVSDNPVSACNIRANGENYWELKSTPACEKVLASCLALIEAGTVSVIPDCRYLLAKLKYKQLPKAHVGPVTLLQLDGESQFSSAGIVICDVDIQNHSWDAVRSRDPICTKVIDHCLEQFRSRGLGKLNECGTLLIAASSRYSHQMNSSDVTAIKAHLKTLPEEGD